jgi:SpoVG
VKIKKSQPYRSGSMLAFLSVETDSGLIIHDLRLMSGRNGPWVAMPSRPQVDREGSPRRDSNGTPRFSPIVEFRTGQIGDRFQQEVLETVRRDRPDLLKGGGS